MIRVVIESPYAGSVEQNIDYARKCVRHSLLRGEAPIASHLLYTQPGILDDHDPLERATGMQCGWEWMGAAVIIAFYVDNGISNGMVEGFKKAIQTDADIEVRSIHSNEGIGVPVRVGLDGTMESMKIERTNISNLREAARMLVGKIPTKEPVN